MNDTVLAAESALHKLFQMIETACAGVFDICRIIPFLVELIYAVLEQHIQNVLVVVQPFSLIEKLHCLVRRGELAAFFQVKQGHARVEVMAEVVNTHKFAGIIHEIIRIVVNEESLFRLPEYPDLDSLRAAYGISAEVGDEVKASADGVVSEIVRDDLLGNYVVIDHENGWRTTYSQLAEINCSVGEAVSAGEIIGSVSEPSIYSEAMGPHVEFMVTLDDVSVNPEVAVG